MIEVYRGSANMWECDEMGHMNVRFYVARLMEALAEFAHVNHMPSAFRSDAVSSLAPRDLYIRHIKEARAGEPLTMRAAVLEVHDASVLIYMQLDHASGDVCAAFRVWVDHIDLDMRRTFPWSPRARSALESLIIKTEKTIEPRSIDFAMEPASEATLASADAISAPTIGRGIVLSEHCDPSGYMKPEFHIARLSDSIGHLLAEWREGVATAAHAENSSIRTGGAVLESRWVFRKWPKAGDRFVIRSGTAFIQEKVHALFHWIADPDTGHAWATNQTLAVTFDLDTRKIIATPESSRIDLLKIAPEGLFL